MKIIMENALFPHAVLLTPRADNVTAMVRPNEKVKYGQPLFTYGS